jgi:hypothetical protein
MNRRSVLCAAGLAPLAATILPVVFHAQPGSPQPGSPAATPRAAAASPAPQHNREIVEAAHLLEDAKRHLYAGEAQPPMHRAKAIAHINNALHECQWALDAHE